MMDLYEAIELIEDWIRATDEHLVGTRYELKCGILYDRDVYDAIKICLEAARDKAGV